MKTTKDLFDLVQNKTDHSDAYRVVLGKWQEYTFQYQNGLGIRGMDSRLTIWRYNHVVCTITCKQLTINDEKRVKSQVAESFHIAELMDAIEQDQTIAIGNVALLWRITLGGYIARKWDSKANQTT